MDSKPSLILHPGHSKCGSSSIQNSLYSQARYLQKQGIYLPDSKFQFQFEPNSIQTGNTSAISYPLMFFKDLYEGKTELSALQKRLDTVFRHAADSDCKSIAISAENLSLLSQVPLNFELHQLLATNFQSIKVIYYMRRQDDWILSCWQQWGHKNGSSFAQMLRSTLNQRLPPFLEVANALQRAYPDAELSVIPLSPTMLHEGDLLVDFYHRAGISLPPSTNRNRKVNSAVNPYFCEILSSIPNLYKDIHDNSIKSALSRYTNDQSLLFRRHESFVPVSLRHQIMAHFYQDNQELHRRFFPAQDFDTLFGIDEGQQDESALSDIEALKEIVAIQTEILIGLLKSK